MPTYSTAGPPSRGVETQTTSVSCGEALLMTFHAKEQSRADCRLREKQKRGWPQATRLLVVHCDRRRIAASSSRDHAKAQARCSDVDPLAVVGRHDPWPRLPREAQRA